MSVQPFIPAITRSSLLAAAAGGQLTAGHLYVCETAASPVLIRSLSYYDYTVSGPYQRVLKPYLQVVHATSVATGSADFTRSRVTNCAPDLGTLSKMTHQVLPTS
jgi:hypothetical protein